MAPHLRDKAVAAFALSAPLPVVGARQWTSGVNPVQGRRVTLSRRSIVSMSGVNGGIDYEIDLNKLPSELAERVKAIQVGPDSPLELIAAAKDIAAASTTTPETLPVLVDMLGYNNPVAARIAVDALVKAGKLSIPSLLIGVGAFNYAVNAYALRALAGVGDPSVAAVCAACAKKGPIPGVRRAACAALSALYFNDIDAAKQAYDVLLRIADGEPDWGVRYAAVVGIERFVARDLLPDTVRESGVNVLEGILNGDRVFPPPSDDNDKRHPTNSVRLKSDPTVIARATIALEILRGAPIPA